MGQRERLLCVLVAALTGGALALVGAPAPVSLPHEEPLTPAVATQRLMRTPVTAMAVAPTPAAPLGEAARGARAAASLADLPAEVRLCWSPTARRLLGQAAKAQLERLGSRVKVCVESDRGARGRLARGADDLALIAGVATDDEREHGVVSRVLGYHVLVAIVHENNPLASLPGHLLRAALIGEATDWQHLGAGRSAKVTVAGVAEDPFTDQATSLVLLGDRLARGCQRLADDDAVCTFVANDEGALGLCSLAAAQRLPAGIRVLRVDNIAPSAAAFVAGQYPYASPIRLLAKDARHCAWLGDDLAGDALSQLK
jgi:hypothetical protein